MNFRLLQQLLHWPETLTSVQLQWIRDWAWDQWFATGERIQFYSDLYQMAMDETDRRWFERAYERTIAVPPLALRLDRSQPLIYC